MPTLTRRRANPDGLESWQIFRDNVRVGTIGIRPGVPMHAAQWGWHCGFYPGMPPATQRSGSADTFDEARAAFEAAWSELSPKITEAMFDEWRQDHDWRAEMAARKARGERLPSEIPTSTMRCACGIVFDSHNPAENHVHAPHIYAAHAAKAVSR